MFQKILGPLMTGGGLIAAPFTGGATLPIALSGLTSMTGPGGVLGSSPSTPPSIKAPALTAAPMAGSDMASIPTPAGQGLSLSGGGAGAGGGAGVQSPDVIQQAVANAMGGQSADPFAMYQAAA
jgi:hypothetical protein